MYKNNGYVTMGAYCSKCREGHHAVGGYTLTDVLRGFNEAGWLLEPATCPDCLRGPTETEKLVAFTPTLQGVRELVPA